MNRRFDIPKLIARVLFIGGIFWAAFLIPLTAGTVLVGFAGHPRVLVCAAYLLCGYAVWAGWRWRSRAIRPLRASVALWLMSVAVNAAFLFALAADGDFSRGDLLGSSSGFDLFLLLWWTFASGLSLIGGVYEFRTTRQEMGMA